MKKLTWEEIDKCKSGNMIARLLNKNKIKGRQEDPYLCPLAKATGYRVTYSYRTLQPREGYLEATEEINLTKEEKIFIRKFDNGEYPFLIQGK